MEIYNNCINCGTKNEELTKFCVECGASLVNTTVNDDAAQPTIHHEEKSLHINEALHNDIHSQNETNLHAEPEEIVAKAQSKRPVQASTKKSRTKLIAALISAGIIIAGGAGAYVYLNGEKETAITAQLADLAKEDDYKAFLQLIELDAIDFYEEDTYIEYLKSFGLEDIVDEMNAVINAIEKAEEASVVEVDGVLLFSIEKDKKTKEITIHPNALTVDAVTEVPGLELTLAGEELIFKKKSLSIGTILPGTYKAKLTGEMDGYKVNETIELTLDDTIKELQIMPTTYAIDYDSDYDQTAISIDGRITNPIGDYITIDIPVGNEVEVFGVVEYDGVQYESERMTVSDTTSIHFTFPDLDQYIAEQNTKGDVTTSDIPNNFPTDIVEQRISVWQLASEIIPSFLHVYENGDMESLSEYVYDKTPFYTSHLKVMKDNAKNGTTVELLLVTIDTVEILEENKFVVTTSEDYKVTKQGKNPTTPSQKTKYTVQFVNGQLYITDLDL